MPKLQTSISAEELVARLISTVIFNEVSKRTLDLPNGNAEVEAMKSQTLYETGLLALYAVMVTALNHPLLKGNPNAHRFADILQEQFYQLIVSKTESALRLNKVRSISADFVNRWDKYDAIINKINSNPENETYVVEFEKTVNGFLGINDTKEEIITRLNAPNPTGWYMFLHLRAADAKRILDKHDAVTF